MALIFSDTFTDTGGVLLENHTPTTGTSWTAVWQSTAGDGFVIDTGNVLSCPSNVSDGAIYTADTTYSTADYSISATMNTLSSDGDDPLYMLVRVQDQENMYAVRLIDQGGTNTCQLYKKVAGTWSTLGSAFTPPANGSVIKLEIIGTALKFYDDGVEIASATDSAISAAGKAGLAAGGGAELVNSGDDLNITTEIDNLEVNTVGDSTPTISKSESITVSESRVLRVDHFITKSDSVAVTESVAMTVTFNINVSESVILTESTNQRLDHFVNKSESVALTESVSVFQQSVNVSASESVSVSESTQFRVDHFIATSDSVSVSESTALTVQAGDLSINVSDSVAVAESVSVSLGSFSVNVSEAITATEAVTMGQLVIPSIDLEVDLKTQSIIATLNPAPRVTVDMASPTATGGLTTYPVGVSLTNQNLTVTLNSYTIISEMNTHFVLVELDS